MIKLCKKCLTTKPKIEFNKDKTRLDGLHIWCRTCTKQYGYKWRHEAPLEKREKAKADTKQWIKNNPDRIYKTNLAWRTKHLAHVRQRDKKWWYENALHHQTWRRLHKAHINARNSARRSSKLRATPTWAELDKITIVYDKAVELSKCYNIRFEVDHIIPLISDSVCGLHCWHNLQLLEKTINAAKRNNYQTDW